MSTSSQQIGRANILIEKTDSIEMLSTNELLDEDQIKQPNL